MRRSALLTILAVAAAFLIACTGTPEVKPPAPASPSPVSSPAASPAVSPTGSPASTSKGKADSLLGRWSGPEGTNLSVTAKGDKYTIEIGPKTYEGTAKGDVIEFIRDGKTETVKAATGAETGIKGFEKETTCVLITKGKEGFCKK